MSAKENKRRAVNMIGAGLAIGVGVGVATDNISLGIGVGLATGAALQKKQGRKHRTDDENNTPSNQNSSPK